MTGGSCGGGRGRNGGSIGLAKGLIDVGVFDRAADILSRALRYDETIEGIDAAGGELDRSRVIKRTN